MTPDETKMQARKIQLMKIAMLGGFVFAFLVLSLLEKIAQNTALCK